MAIGEPRGMRIYRTLPAIWRLVRPGKGPTELMKARRGAMIADELLPGHHLGETETIWSRRS